MMGGKINVESKLGKGSLFRIELPRQVSSVLDKEVAQTNHKSPSKKVVNNKKQGSYRPELHSKKQQE